MGLRSTVRLAALVAMTPALLALASGQPADPAKTKPAEPAQKQPAETPKSDKPSDSKANPETKPAKEQLVYVEMKTSLGSFTLELDAKAAPLSVENFMKYAEKGFYEGTIFHRVIKGFMIQGGGFNPDMSQKPVEAPIKNEWKNGLKNKKYTISMARTFVADSATSQFFINTKDNTFLDEARDGAAYAVFGKVVDGTDTIDTIEKVPTGTGPNNMGDVPRTVVTIEKVRRLTAEESAKFAGKQ